MTERAQQLSQTIEEVSWDWETMQPSHPHTIAVATLRAVASNYSEFADIFVGKTVAVVTVDTLLELVNELEALK